MAGTDPKVLIEQVFGKKSGLTDGQKMVIEERLTKSPNDDTSKELLNTIKEDCKKRFAMFRNEKFSDTKIENALNDFDRNHPPQSQQANVGHYQFIPAQPTVQYDQSLPKTQQYSQLPPEPQSHTKHYTQLPPEPAAQLPPRNIDNTAALQAAMGEATQAVKPSVVYSSLPGDGKATIENKDPQAKFNNLTNKGQGQGRF